MEIWKPITKFFLENYEVSNLGNIRHIKHKKNRKLFKNKYGHLVFDHKSKNYYIHRLEFETFYPGEFSEEKVINHINNDPSDNRIENLECITQAENTRHYYDNFHTYKEEPLKAKIKTLLDSREWASAQEFYESIKNL